eukprot:TRINITY_DN81103_c0_g1_i1.p1 TRINITY_DN81103_c0_g1~~TRINITY_DN81103_c0_g1_i1.p1  ORF type:complete len:492 (-),score=104.64 TRINITY_DN81103_c0_g1_i1:103-1578(-)
MTDYVIVWIRRDLRLFDHAAWTAAIETGAKVVPVFVYDEVVELYGSAPKWRLQEGLRILSRTLGLLGSRLILRRGNASKVLLSLALELGVIGVHWQRAYDMPSRKRDAEVERVLEEKGITVETHGGTVLFEPMSVENGQGGPYRVFTPYWNAVKDRDVGDILPVPEDLSPPSEWPHSESLEDWGLGEGMKAGASIVAKHARVGEDAALNRKNEFLASKIVRYSNERDIPSLSSTSNLSENLAWGEISPKVIWHGALQALVGGKPGAEGFLKELAWREFSWHLMYHFPTMDHENWRTEWDNFPWRGECEDADRWRRGMTGIPFVDAAMRQLFVTGVMHNRGRMVAASFLTKNLLIDWRIGLRWFEECLIDWDPAANAMGWQWVAGCGPDASPFFRIFNPETQAEKFDPSQAYRKKFIAEIQMNPGEEAVDFFRAAPKCWNLTLPCTRYCEPIISLPSARQKALYLYKKMRDRIKEDRQVTKGDYGPKRGRKR